LNSNRFLTGFRIGSGNEALRWNVKDPRFQNFVRRLNLFAYWKKFGPPDECDLQEDKLTCH